MPITGQKGIDIEPGKGYVGKLKNARIVERYKQKDGKQVPIYYLEVDAHTTGHETVLKVSWSAHLTPQTQLGRLLERLNISWEVDAPFDESSLNDLDVKYDVVQDGNFVRVDEESVTPSE